MQPNQICPHCGKEIVKDHLPRGWRRIGWWTPERDAVLRDGWNGNMKHREISDAIFLAGLGETNSQAVAARCGLLGLRRFRRTPEPTLELAAAPVAVDVEAVAQAKGGAA
ncbi:MAG: hypothetical protein IMZ57_02260 [Acidobacteria bacterium]|nr:hypothetical protein [Acidobacteriota bacterium]